MKTEVSDLFTEQNLPLRRSFKNTFTNNYAMVSDPDDDDDEFGDEEEDEDLTDEEIEDEDDE